MTRPQSRSFRNRLLLSFLIASLVPMIICSTMLSQISRIQMTKQLDTDAQTQTAHLMTALDRISDALPGAARALEESRLLPRAFTSREDTQINTALFLATEGSRDLADYSLYDLRGSLRYSTGSVTAGTTLSTRWGVLFAAKNAGRQAVYQAPMDGGKTLLQEAQETKANLRKTMSANPVVSAVIMAFPGAKIDSIRERAEETDDTSNSEDYE